ncbi:hypothetical protein BD410DRAFT_793586 [Rickenella mellea]|uniref:C2H2-type domain-containing protein n=1 Tax=Rickenella mellea TaxID=50990 RepID=A0A4Y7PSE2_9AGAM|nr:hypothetical protein BD410DRAFT_793586 [Rickenella mellea]
MPESADGIQFEASSNPNFFLSLTYPRSTSPEPSCTELVLDEEQPATRGNSPETCNEESCDDEDFGLIVSEVPASQLVPYSMEEVSVHLTDHIDPPTTLLAANTTPDSFGSQFLHDSFNPTDETMPTMNNAFQERDLNTHETSLYAVPVYDTRGYLCQINPQTYHGIHSEVTTEDIHFTNHQEPLTGPDASFAQPFPSQYLPRAVLATTPLFTNAPLIPRSAKHNPATSSAPLTENSAPPRPPQESFPTPRADWWYQFAQPNSLFIQPPPAEAVVVAKWKWPCPGPCGKSYSAKSTLKNHLNSCRNTCERPPGYTVC